MSSVANQNLLYGVLAYQLGMIDRAALVDSLRIWATAKERPLDEILVELNILPEQVRQLLAALVEENLRIHDGSPEQCLTALSSIGSVRDELEAIDDADLHATLGHLTVNTTSPATLEPRGDVRAESTSPTTDGRFRVIKLHAKGGLGQVSVAVDEELSREVALKELQNKFADDDQNRARFLLEAEITGGLEHPGIVPVYGAGSYADGRPYYAMRFVRGDSLQDAINSFHERRQQGDLAEDYNLELRKLLQHEVVPSNREEIQLSPTCRGNLPLRRFKANGDRRQQQHHLCLEL